MRPSQRKQCKKRRSASRKRHQSEIYRHQNGTVCSFRVIHKVVSRNYPKPWKENNNPKKQQVTIKPKIVTSRKLNFSLERNYNKYVIVMGIYRVGLGFRNVKSAPRRNQQRQHNSRARHVKMAFHHHQTGLIRQHRREKIHH